MSQNASPNPVICHKASIGHSLALKLVEFKDNFFPSLSKRPLKRIKPLGVGGRSPSVKAGSRSRHSQPHRGGSTVSGCSSR